MLKQASYGTRRVFKGTLCKKQAPVVRKGYSVPETPSYGTRRIFGARILFSTIHNTMDLVTNICSGATTLVNYSYLWNGVKICALRESGDGLVYRGEYIAKRIPLIALK